MTPPLSAPPVVVWDELFKHGLPTDRATRAAAYKYWAQALLPTFPSGHLIINLGMPWDAEVRNDPARARAPQMVRDIINAIDRQVHGGRYRKVPPEDRVAFFARAETASRYGSEANLHYHMVLAKSLVKAELLDPEVVTRITGKIYGLLNTKYDLCANVRYRHLGPEKGDLDRLISYVTKKMENDADLIFTRENY